jgi:hypothetical protein
MILHEILGTYTPATFLIFLNTDRDLSNWANLDAEMQKTLIHEYIHFLQDITTFYGLMNIVQYVDEIKAANWSILKNGIKEFERPVELLKDFEIVNEGRDLISLYLGETQYLDNLKILNGYDCKLCEYFDEKFEVTLSYCNINDELKSVHLGAFQILESMASLIENYIFSILPSVDYPYNVVDDLVKNCFPNTNNTRENLISLCYLALQSKEPGVHLIKILETMEAQQYDAKTWEDIFRFHDKQMINQINDDYLIMSTLAKKQLLDYFSQDSESDIKKWCNSVLEAGKTLWNERWVLALFNECRSTKIDAIIKLMDFTGLPLVTNNTGLHYCGNNLYDTGRNTSFLRSIHDVFLVLKREANVCSMYEFCSTSKFYLVDERCKTSPWMRANDNNLCPFAYWWHKWGLSEYKPKQK